MADNYLITGYWGEPHVTAENDRGINAATFGIGRFVLPVGQKFNAEYIGNNTIRLYDGKLVDNGAVAGIPNGEYVDLLIPNAGQGLNRNDLIVFQYIQDASTLIEKGEFVVVHGAETEETATDPELTQGDLLSTETAFEQMPLWRVSVSGGAIAAPVRVFEIVNGDGQIGEEYRTTKRYNGNVVYTKTVDIGALPATSMKTFNIGVTRGQIVSIDVIVDNGTYLSSLPLIGSNGSPMVRFFVGTSLGIQTYDDYSAYSGRAIIEYIK